MRTATEQPSIRAPWALTAPALMLFVGVLLIPLAMTVLLSFHDWGQYKGIEPVFIVKNWHEIVSDPYYAEMFWRTRSDGGAQIGNRGVNGIDGNLATALGLAHGGAPAVCLVGDLAFLHDYSALLLAGQMRGSLTIVLLNNDGGGVFEFLPIAQHNPPFEKYFATPQTVDVSALCAAHAIDHQIIRDWQQFETACKTLPPGVRVLELKTDRKIDHSTHLNFLKQ